MFIGMIAVMISLLIIVSYMSTSSIVVDASKVKVAFEKIKNVYTIEKVIVDGVEHLCQYDRQICKDNEVGGEITLTLTNLSGYIPENFYNDNLYGGVFYIQILNNYTTIRLTHDLIDPIVKNVYLKHYQGNSSGIPPKCITYSGAECTSQTVYHDYATSLKTRASLED